jgi:hypothetical protein
MTSVSGGHFFCTRGDDAPVRLVLLELLTDFPGKGHGIVDIDVDVNGCELYKSATPSTLVFGFWATVTLLPAVVAFSLTLSLFGGDVVLIAGPCFGFGLGLTFQLLVELLAAAAVTFSATLFPVLTIELSLDVIPESDEPDSACPIRVTLAGLITLAAMCNAVLTLPPSALIGS